MIAGFILFIATIIFLRLVLPPPSDIGPGFFSDLTCPPHQWNWQEVKDKEGNITAHRMVCARCGPLKKQDTTRDDYK